MAGTFRTVGSTRKTAAPSEAGPTVENETRSPRPCEAMGYNVYSSQNEKPSEILFV